MQPTSSEGPRALTPPSGSWSRQTWVAERAAARISSLAAELPKLCEPIGPVVLFLEGSALHGELCGIVDPAGGRRCLSDLDIGILTRERIQPEMRGSIARRLEGGAGGGAADGPALKLGFYCEADAGVQDPTLAFVEAVRHPLVLWGDPRALERFEAPDHAGIPAWEGRRLAANRVLEWLAARRSGEVARAYAGAKLIADAAAVALLSRGAYRGGGYAERCAAASRLTDLPEEIRGPMRGWTAWRLEPRWETTPLGVGLGDLEPRIVEEEVRAALLASMRFAAATDDPGVFLGVHAVRGRAWARSWKRWLRRKPGSLAHLRSRWAARTPRVLLFEAAIACALGREETAAGIIMPLAGEGAGAEREGDSLAARIVEIGEMMGREGID